MMDELRAHEARFSVDDEPCPSSDGPLCSGIADGVHFGMNATDFDFLPGRYLGFITKTAIRAAEARAATRPPIVAFGNDDVAGRFDEYGPELPSRAVGTLSEEETLLESHPEVFQVHGEGPIVKMSKEAP